VLVELNVVAQRNQAVLEVLDDGASVTDVARRHGVARQTVHEWLRRYAAGGLGGLADHSSKPLSCPHQMPGSSRRGSWRCAARIRGGDCARSWSGWTDAGWELARRAGW
jgi:transposase-like protein